MNKCLVCIGMLYLCASAQGLSFYPPETIKANGQPIVASVGNASPQVEDWNGDGKKDLLVGQFSGGKIRLFLNSGTNNAPVFTTSTFLQADGKEISLTAS